MKKTISQAQLSSRQARGAKVKGEVKPVTPSPVASEAKPDTGMIDLATKTIESANRVEEVVTNSLAISDENMTKMMEALQEAMIANVKTLNPIPYDLIIKRRRDGLMETVRLQPVIEGNLH